MNPVILKKRLPSCGTLRKEGATVIFAGGELYCFAVVFGLRPSHIRFASFEGEYNITKTDRFSYHSLEISRLWRGVLKNITVRPVSQYHLLFLSLREVNVKICTPVTHLLKMRNPL